MENKIQFSVMARNRKQSSPVTPRPTASEIRFREAALEQRFRKLVEAMGGECLKFVSPGRRGVPDRLVILPGGRVFFVEFKAPGRKPDPIQEAMARRITDRGVPVYVVDSVDAFAGVLDGTA